MKNDYRIIDFKQIEGVPCPCGTARRGLYEVAEFPGTIHRTDIDRSAKPHFHKTMTEVYYVISCEPDTVMQLNEERVPLHEEMAIYVPPGVVHRVLGTAKVLIVVLPKFDPTDEFLDDESSGL